MNRISPFLWFDSQAEDAAKFYTSIFKKSKVGRISRYPEGAPGPKGSVMAVEFTIEGQRFTALNGGATYKITPAISFVVHCKNQKEVDHYWGKLLSGGGQPVACGWLTDRFGVSWQVVPDLLMKLIADKDAKKAARVTHAMMQMIKLDVALIQRAARGV